MIKDVATLTIKRERPEVPAELVARFRGAMTGHLVDCMGGRGSLSASIKPQQQTRAAICGPALTVRCYPADNLALLAATACVRPGDVVVCATDAFREVALTGDLVLGMLKNAGAGGLVTDGALRDQDGVEACGLPVFHGGVTPNSPAATGPGEIGLPVICGGIPVATGDIVVADRDGVVIVPLAKAEEVLSKLEEVRKAEAALEAEVQAGLITRPHIREMLDSGQVQWV